MSISNPVTTSAATVGTTVTSLTKAGVGYYVNNNAGVYTELIMKAANLSKAKKRISVQLKRDLTLAEVSPATTNGKVNGFATFDFTLGSTVTATYARNFLKELGSLLSQDAIIDALISGSYE